MESWEELIKTLPSDETLEQKEKNGELEEIDKRLAELQAKTEKMKEEIAEREEIYNMLNNGNSTQQEQTTKKTK